MTLIITTISTYENLFRAVSLLLYQSVHSATLPAVSGLVLLFSGDPLLKSSYRLKAFWLNTWPSIRTHFLFISSTHTFNAFSILTKHLSLLMHRGCNFCSLKCNSKTSTDFFFLFHNFTDRFVLILDVSSLSI